MMLYVLALTLFGAEAEEIIHTREMHALHLTSGMPEQSPKCIDGQAPHDDH